MPKISSCLEFARQNLKGLLYRLILVMYTDSTKFFLSQPVSNIHRLNNFINIPMEINKKK